MTGIRPTSFFEVTGLGASLPVLRSVAPVWFISAGEDHESLIGEAKLDVAVKVCAAPQGIAQGSLPTAHGLFH